MTELEIMQRAKMYMEKLAQGIDPISDQEIPEDSVLRECRYTIMPAKRIAMARLW